MDPQQGANVFLAFAAVDVALFALIVWIVWRTK